MQMGKCSYFLRSVTRKIENHVMMCVGLETQVRFLLTPL